MDSALEGREIQVFVVLRQEARQHVLQVVPVPGAGTLAKMKQEPELEAGVGDRELDPSRMCTLPCIVEPGVVMLVHVKNAPDLVEA
jgi:hypothetical protein